MRFLLVLALGTSLIPAATAETYVVQPDGSGDYPTIQAAIDHAGWGDVIELADGTFTGDGNRDLNYQGKPITVRSQSGNPEACVIDCQASETDCHRGVDFTWGEGPGSILEGVTITNGYVELVNQYPEGLGGGVRVLGPNCTPTIHDVILLENLAWVGAGLGIDQASPIVTECTFRRNDAWWGGGGAVWARDCDSEFTGCTFIENNGYQVGGAVDCAYGTFGFSDCRFEGNTVNHGYGAGVSLWWDVVAEIDGCTFLNNGPAEWGGGLSVMTDSEATVRSCTFSGNEAIYSGGGIHVEHNGCSAVIENSIIAFSPQGDAVGCTQEGDVTLSCCDLFGNAGGDWTGCISTQLGQAGNIELDPRFCDAAGGDLGLLPESPCAPFSEPNPECDLIGAWPVGCMGQHVPESITLGDGRLHLSAMPNPFLQATQVSFLVPGQVEDPVTLHVLDAAGRQIRTLVTHASQPGSNRITWDGTDRTGEPVAAGVYLVRLSQGENSVSRRVVLVK